MLWSDAPLRQLRGCSPDASVSPTSSSRSSPRPRSVVLVDPLPPSTAPLWRNAPNHHHQPPPARRNTPPNHATISPAVSFQQSLRSYPVSSFPSSSTSKGTVHNAATKLGAHPHQHQFNLHQPKNVAAEGPGSRRAGPGTGRLPQSKTVPAALSSAAAPKERTANKKQPSECHVTSLEGESSTPFFLDYLDSQSAMVAANPMLAQPLGAFNHRQFMEMFRSEPSSEQTNANAGQAANAAAAAAFSLSGAAAAGASGAAGGADDLGSLPYAVNTALETGQQQPQFLLPEHYHLGARSSAPFDSLASTVGSDQHSYSRPTPVDQRRSAPKSAAAPGGYSKAGKRPSQTLVFETRLSTHTHLRTHVLLTPVVVHFIIMICCLFVIMICRHCPFLYYTTAIISDGCGVTAAAAAAVVVVIPYSWECRATLAAVTVVFSVVALGFLLFALFYSYLTSCFYFDFISGFKFVCSILVDSIM